MDCEFCHKPTHIWFDCPTKPAGWRPARLAKKSDSTRAIELTPTFDARRDAVRVTARKDGHPSTAARKDVPRLAEDRTATASGAATEQRAKYGVEAGTQALPVDTPKRGRPSTGFDKRAYNRQYMADRRAGKR